VSRHVFIDNSNIYGGAQRAARTIEPTAFPLAVRVHIRNLIDLMEAGDPAVTTKVLAGSVPPDNEALWDHARRAGYDTNLLKKVEDDQGRLVEQGVDEMLHLKIANALLDHEPPQTMVIASGDGSISSWNTGFPMQAERALRRGWNVEVWSWVEQLTGQYDAICKANRGRIIVRVLDPHYHALTFVQAGDYHAATGETVSVAPRAARALALAAPALVPAAA
jgi:hypothetical protein